MLVSPARTLAACAFLHCMASVQGFAPSSFLGASAWRLNLKQHTVRPDFLRSTHSHRSESLARLRCSSNVQDKATKTTAYTVDDFVASFSGEWIGYETEYRAESGELIPVPEYQLPEELVEWGEVVKAYEHLSSSTASDANLRIKRSRLLPSCGCGVDAVPTDVFTVETCLQTEGSATVFEGGAVLSCDGAGREPVWTVVLPAEEAEGVQRRVQVAGRGMGASCRTVQVWMEERVRDYEDGNQYWEIFRDPAFLKRMEHPDLPACAPSDLEGLSLASSSLPLLPATASATGDASSSAMEALPCACLPSGVTVQRFAAAGKGTDGGLEVGWLRPDGTRSVLAWSWEGGGLTAATHRVEAAGQSA